MKSLLSGIACMCLVLFPAAPGFAQQRPAPTPNPPAVPAPSEPADDQQETGSGTLMKIPELPKIPEVRLPGERGVSFGLSFWSTTTKPDFIKGTFPYDYPGTIGLQGKPKFNPGIDVGVAVGLHNTIRLTAFSSSATGYVAAPTNIGLIGQYYLQGDYLATDYHIKSVKLSFDYLTWPYPVKTSRFRLKSLWSIQYTQVRVGFDAPYLSVLDSLGNRLTDSSGNPLSYATAGTYRYYLPGIGLGIQEYVTPRFRLELNASGFDIPHHSNNWDADASANFRTGHIEFRAGVRGFHFRTSPQAFFWVQHTMVGPFVALRWYSDEAH